MMGGRTMKAPLFTFKQHDYYLHGNYFIYNYSKCSNDFGANDINTRTWNSAQSTTTTDKTV